MKRGAVHPYAAFFSWLMRRSSQVASARAQRTPGFARSHLHAYTSMQTIDIDSLNIARASTGSVSARHHAAHVTTTRYDCSMKIFLLDSISEVSAETQGQIVVSGSHGGVSAARLALAYPPALVIFNDAGLGMDEAGVAGLHVMQDEAIAACAVSHMSARIGSAQSTLNLGLITSINEIARAARIQIGMSTQQAIDTYQLYR
jgi:hypothetical protein